jgi:Fe-S-cluster containining protein
MKKDKIFIPFSDGRLDYDCRECGAGCCQGGMITANEKERKILLDEYPSIKYFSAGERNGMYMVQKYPSCWFLDQDLDCGIQHKYGYSLKPFICRLHPFYVARCGQEYVVIPSGCDQLQVADLGKQGRVSHDPILANAEEAVECGWFNDEIEWPAERLDLERKILAESERFSSSSDYVDFAAVQIAAATSSSNLSSLRGQLNEKVALWKAFLGLKDAITRNELLDYELVTLTSLLRVTNPTLRKLDAPQVPEALLALYVCMLIFSEVGHQKRVLGTYTSILSDLPLGLVQLTEKDLKMIGQPLEKRLTYIRRLREISAPGFLKRVRPK